jgi:phosphatidylserine decarboxylase
LLQPKWYPLESKRPGRKSGTVTGDVQLQFSISDPAAPDASDDDIIKRLAATVGSTASDMGDEGDSPELEESPEQSEATAAESSSTLDVQEKKKRRILRIANLRKRAKERGYEFFNASPVAGVLFIEIQKITDLPPERNGKTLLICMRVN